MKIELIITPIIGAYEMPYNEVFNGTFVQLQARVNELQQGLSLLLPDEVFRIKVTEINGSHVFFNEHYRWVDSNFKAVTIRKQFSLN